MERYCERYSVGLTGGIGSGKTTVTDHFKKLGAGIVDADEVSRSLTADGRPAVEILAQEFGNHILEPTGGLDRDKLRQIVFADPGKKQRLEQILHPMIRSEMADLAREMNNPYLIFSIPLLIESGQRRDFDRILIVEAPEDLRCEWIKKRSGLDERQIRQIMKSQATTAQRLQLADDVINNDSSLEDLYQQVEQLHQKYLRLSEIDSV